jgi:hypothetical protein
MKTPLRCGGMNEFVRSEWAKAGRALASAEATRAISVRAIKT